MNYICGVRNNFIAVPEMLVSLYLQNKTLKPNHRKQLVVPRSFRSDEQASIMGFSFGYSTGSERRNTTSTYLPVNVSMRETSVAARNAAKRPVQKE